MCPLSAYAVPGESACSGTFKLKPSSGNSWHHTSGTRTGGVCAQFSMHCPLLTVAIDLSLVPKFAPSATRVRHEDVSEALPPAGWMLLISTCYIISCPYPQRWNLADTWGKSPIDCLNISFHPKHSPWWLRSHLFKRIPL